MFLIKIDGKKADWQQGMSVRLNRKNPVFEFDSITGNLVNDFILPFTPQNDKIFGHFANPQVNYPDKDYHCEKYIDGTLIEEGFVQFKDVLADGYQVIYIQNFGEFFGDFQNTTMNLIDFGNEAIPANFNANPNPLTDKYCLPVIENSAFYGTNEQPNFNGLVNEYTSGAYVGTAPKTPMLFVRFVFDLIGQKCNCTFSGEFFSHPELQKLIVYNTFSLDEATQITYQNHLPEITIPEFLKEFGKLFNLAFFINVQERTVTVRFGDILLNNPTKLNWTNKIVPSVQRSAELANRLELDWDLEGNDDTMKEVPSSFQKYQTPQEGVRRGVVFPIRSKFSSLIKNPTTGRAVATQVGITPYFNQMNATFSARILFWNGLVASEPRATNESGDYTIALHGSGNLIEKFWTNYQAFRAKTALRKVNAVLNASDLAQVDFHRKKGEFISIHVRGRDYYIDEIAIPLPLEGQESELLIWES